MSIFLKIAFLIPVGILSTGCAYLLSRPSAEPAVSETEKNEITVAEKLLADRKFEEAKASYQKFQALHPYSVFVQAARLGEAQAYYGLEDYQSAANLARDVNLATVRYQPDIAALAWYQMSFDFEALGEDHKAVAALLDAQTLSKYLPATVALAEIPARLAAAFGRQGRDEEALKYIEQAELGIQKINADKTLKLKKDWLGKAYVQMGSISTNQISKENFEDAIKGQKWVQVYLIKALRLNDSNWSLQAQNRLQNTYRDLYTLISSTEDRELQKNMAGDIFDLMDQADLYKPYADQKMNSYETSFFTYLAQIRKKTENYMYGGDSTMGLTRDSEHRNSLKRSRVNTQTVLPEQKNSSIHDLREPAPSEDPNL
ncbi:MAG: tetratricopeptide repeat protein [Bdellovibrio sp.]